MNSINRNIFIINKKSIIINIFCGLLKIICSYYSIMANLESMVIDLNPDDKSVINIADKPSVNFGGGIELLMNDKKKGGSTEIGIGELSELENDLNNLSDDIGKKSLENSRSAIFNESINKFNTTSNTDNQTPMEVKFSDLKSEFELFLFSDLLVLNRENLKAANSFILTLQKDNTSIDSFSRRINVRKLV